MALALLCTLLLWPIAVSATVDIHGPWQLLSNGTTELVDVVQAGDAISFTYRGFALTGTLSEAGRLQVEGGTDPYDALVLDGDVAADGQLLNAGTFGVAPGAIFTLTTLLGTRCGCVDGNADNGDGCDAECQVEPCWTCTGSPSVCVPAGDGTACDAGVCVGGATCTGGSCGGGAPVAPCFDLSGTWAVHAVKSANFTTTETDFTRIVRQRGTHVLVADSPTWNYFGTIDPATGTFAWSKIGGFYGFDICGSGVNAVRMPFTGSITAAGVSFVATGTETVNAGRCPFPVDVIETGTRAGCADGTPCSSGNACLTGETCLAGACQGGTAVTCAPCEACDPTDGCVPTPLPACLAPGRPAMLSIKNTGADDQDKIDWRWRSPAALGPLGDPLASDGVTLCVYDTTVSPTGLVFRSVVPGGGQCGTHPCWKAARIGTGFTFTDRSAAHDGTRRFGALGSPTMGSRVKYRGKGAGLSGRPFGLPALPLPTSLYVQLQADGGACVGAAYFPSGVKKNDPATGTYRATSQ